MHTTLPHTKINSSTLSPAQRRLLQRMHRIYHGTMLCLPIREGEPILDPPPKVRQAFKLGGSPVQLKVVPGEFTLKEQQVELLSILTRKRNGVISKLVIQDGLPFFVEWEDPYRD